MNVLTFKYLFLLIGLIGAHARSSLSESDSEEQEGSGEDENGIEDNGIEDGYDELEIMPEERDKPETAEGTMIEGDIIVSGSKMRNAKASLSLWPGGIVPYELDNTKFSRGVIANITRAMAEITTKTGNCIKFKEKDEERQSIYFITDKGCSSKVGMDNTAQPVSIGLGCYQFGTIIHELSHVLRVPHHHNRPDRAKYVKVNWSNIGNTLRGNFAAMPMEDESFKGIPYCYKSIMHYGNYAFGSNKKVKTLTALKQPSMELGQRTTWENCDIQYLKKLYKCVGGKSGIPMTEKPSDPIKKSYSSGSSYSRSSRPSSGSSYSRTSSRVSSSRRVAGRK